MNDDEQNEIKQYANSKMNKHVNGETSRQIEEKEGEPVMSRAPGTNF